MLLPLKSPCGAQRKRGLPWAALLLCLWQPSAYALECKSWQGDTAALEGKTIGTVSIAARDIFNTALGSEDHWVQKLANNLHYQTRRSTIANQLLFAEGDVFSQRVLDESERLLRGKRFLARADIQVLQVCDDKVWVRVETYDTWSTTPELSISRVAGQNLRKVSLEENNLLGLGHELAFSYDEDLDRTSRAFSYNHHDWMGKRRELGVEFQNNLDGERYQLLLAKPFFSMNDKNSWTADVLFDQRDTMLYDAAEISETMAMEQRFLDLSQSWSKGLQDGELDRWTVGLRIDERSFERVEDSVADEVFESRRERYPYVRLERIEEKFVELLHVRELSGIEDINLGTEYSIEAGYGARAWGATQDGLLLRLTHQRGHQWSQRSLLLVESWISTHLADGDFQQQRIGTQGQVHTRIDDKNQIFFEVHFETGHDLNPEEQLALGGDSGLRGFAFREQTGNRLLRMSTELRHYPDWNPWKALRFGAAIFLDYGSAWDAGGDRPEELWDVGMGLRLGSSRSSSGKVLHFDLAIPEGTGSPQLTATTRLHF